MMYNFMVIGGSQFIHPRAPYHQPPWSYAQQGPVQQGHSRSSFQGMFMIIIILYSRERGSMGGVPYFRLKRGVGRHL